MPFWPQCIASVPPTRVFPALRECFSRVLDCRDRLPVSITTHEGFTGSFVPATRVRYMLRPTASWKHVIWPASSLKVLRL